MSDTRQFRIDKFTEHREHVRYNIGHIVLDDGNTDDDSIEFAINYLDNHRAEYKSDHKEVTDFDIDEVRDFLVSLLGVKEGLE